MPGGQAPPATRRRPPSRRKLIEQLWRACPALSEWIDPGQDFEKEGTSNTIEGGVALVSMSPRHAPPYQPTAPSVWGGTPEGWPLFKITVCPDFSGHTAFKGVLMCSDGDGGGRAEGGGTSDAPPTIASHHSGPPLALDLVDCRCCCHEHCQAAPWLKERVHQTLLHR